MSDFDTPQPLHPESKTFLDALKKLNLKAYHELETIEEARHRSRLASRLGSDIGLQYDGTREELFAKTPDVPDGIPLYVYKPKNVSANPAILIYFHGGGNVVGCRDNVDSTCKLLSSGAACIVVNVEYRLAPEHKFPAMMNDACAVTKWTIDNRTIIGGTQQSKVGVAGDSAGGQIASSVAHDVPGLAFQILIYGHFSALGDRSPKSFQEYENGPIIPRDLINWFENLAADRKDWNNPRLANLLRDNFEHLPPCLFIVAECDPLRDNSYAYSAKLTAAGVHNDLHLAKGAIHAFFTLPGLFPELSGAANDKAIAFIKKFGY